MREKKNNFNEGQESKENNSPIITYNYILKRSIYLSIQIVIILVLLFFFTEIFNFFKQLYGF